MPTTITDDSASIGVTEYFLASDSVIAVFQTTKGVIQAFVDLANMVAGDQFTFRAYRKVNAGAARVVWQITRSGAQPDSLMFPAIVAGDATSAWEFSIQKDAGTDRSFGWSIAKVTE